MRLLYLLQWTFPESEWWARLSVYDELLYYSLKGVTSVGFVLTVPARIAPNWDFINASNPSKLLLHRFFHFASNFLRVPNAPSEFSKFKSPRKISNLVFQISVTHDVSTVLLRSSGPRLRCQSMQHSPAATLSVSPLPRKEGTKPARLNPSPQFSISRLRPLTVAFLRPSYLPLRSDLTESLLSTAPRRRPELKL